MKSTTTSILRLSIAVCCLMFTHFAEAQASKQTSASYLAEMDKLIAEMEKRRDSPENDPDPAYTERRIKELKEQRRQMEASNGKIAAPPPKASTDKPVEQKPKLSPEEEARRNDFNKSANDSPDKYSAENNYNQHDGDGLFKFKYPPSRKEGENELAYKHRRREWEESELSKERDEKIRQEYYKNIETGRFRKPAESVDDELNGILDKGKADINGALNQRKDSMKAEQSKLAEAGGLATRVDQNLRSASSTALWTGFQGGVDLANGFASSASVGAKVPVAGGRSSASDIAKMQKVIAADEKIRAEGSCGLYGLTPAELEIKMQREREALKWMQQH